MDNIKLYHISAYLFGILSNIIDDWKGGIWNLEFQTDAYVVDSLLTTSVTLCNDEINAHLDTEGHFWLIIRDEEGDEINLGDEFDDTQKVLSNSLIRWTKEVYLTTD